jgi:hypothetical protein
LCPVGSTGLIIIANEKIEVRRGMGHPEHIIVCSAEMEDKNSSENAVLPRRHRHCRRAFCLVDDVELVNAIRLVRAQQGK